MKIDYRNPGVVKINMCDYVTKMIEDFPVKIEKEAATPAGEHLFKINPNSSKINKNNMQDFHTFVAKGLFLCKRARPDIQTAIAYLSTRVKSPDEDDWKKLIRLMEYLNGTKDLVLT